jgi:hypothetical protein
MLCSLIDLLKQPDDYVCVWRDGEIYIEPLAASLNTDTESTQETSEEADLPLAA